jgi:hypothetical protein
MSPWPLPARTWLPLCLAFFCLAGGCVRTTMVPLSYSPAVHERPECRLSLTVPGFADARGDVEGVGRTEDGRVYYPDRLVEDWVTSAFRRELRSAGCQVSKQPSREAQTNGFILRGSVERAWLRQVSSTEYTVNLELNLRVFRGERRVHAESFKASLQRIAFPRQELPELLMQENLQDLMRVMVPTTLRVCREAADRPARE